MTASNNAIAANATEPVLYKRDSASRSDISCRTVATAYTGSPGSKPDSVLRTAGMTAIGSSAVLSATVSDVTSRSDRCDGNCMAEKKTPGYGIDRTIPGLRTVSAATPTTRAGGAFATCTVLP